ncbi:hypothetical protein MSG28_014664 [Choristoneura fumiferana]|nr:hypothetical protein MSG28_014664 [Choristoneura fumiferana]KAI8427020.1 hypothetical protein MSG28_014664 [Choristoneura fumiferana]KAI8427022.1 hypothetical protein MSG28_014664 [Choristoneura fumiferana]
MDDDCELPLNPELIHLICPHCHSQIALFDDFKKPQPAKSYPIVPLNQSQSRHSCPAQRKSINTRSASTETTNIGEYCLPTCPSKKSIEMKPQSCHSPVPPCCGSDLNVQEVEQPERRSPHISQVKVATSDDPKCPTPPLEPVPKSCCKSANAIHCAANENRTRPTCCSEMGGNAPPVSKTQMKTGAATCPMCQPPPVQCKVCMQAMAASQPPKCCPIITAGQADQSSQKQTHRGSQPIQKSHTEAQSARDSSSKGKDKQKPIMPGTVEIPEALKPISWLAGRWTTQEGQGKYPNIPEFQYHEVLDFTCIGQPMFNFSSTSTHPVKQTPMHQERGFLRIKPGTNNLAFVISQNIGLTSLEEGSVNPEKQEIVLDTVNVSRMSFAKKPFVKRLKRVLKLVDPNTLDITK